MNRRKVVNYALRGITILIISAAIMVLFWYHDLLYQFGLLTLAVFGGLGIAGLVSAFGWLTRPYSPLKKSRISLFFPPDHMAKVIFGGISMLALPIDGDEPPRCGSTCAARIEGDPESVFTHLSIKNIRRKILEDLEEEELRQLGFENLGKLLERFKDLRKPLSREDPVYLIEFETPEKGRF
ncbi:MAG: hypothetical protein ACE5KV_05900 [Thermoplasmata archaeon]